MFILHSKTIKQIELIKNKELAFNNVRSNLVADKFLSIWKKKRSFFVFFNQIIIP